MKLTSLQQTERLVQSARFQLWFALGALLFIGAGMLVDMLFPNLTCRTRGPFQSASRPASSARLARAK